MDGPGWPAHATDQAQAEQEHRALRGKMMLSRVGSIKIISLTNGIFFQGKKNIQSTTLVVSYLSLNELWREDLRWECGANGSCFGQREKMHLRRKMWGELGKEKGRKPGMEVWKKTMGISWSVNLENHTRETVMMKSVIEEFR